MTDSHSSEFQTIPLDEIIPGAHIRCTVIGGIQYLSTRDFIMHMCDKDNNHAAEIWRRLSVDLKTELNSHCVNFQFKGRGQSEQAVITFPGAIKLLMFLPGEKAKINRSFMTEILVRYFAGDPTLIREVEANTASDDPVAEMARASLPAFAHDHADLRLKRKREELEFVKSGMEFYVNISTNKALDERGLVVFKDAVLALHTKDLLEIEDTKLQQTKEKLLMEREHLKEKLCIERAHSNEMLEMENKKMIAENVNSREALEIEHQHAKKMLELDKQIEGKEHTKEMSDIDNQEQSFEKEEVNKQWQSIPYKDFPEINKCDLTLGMDYVSSLLRDKMKPWTVQVNYHSLLYRLKRYNPKIQVVKRYRRIFFKNDDLVAIRCILFKKLLP
jgi:hypothetical protein